VKEGEKIVSEGEGGGAGGEGRLGEGRVLVVRKRAFSEGGTHG